MGKIKNSLVSLVVGAGLVFGAGAVDVARGDPRYGPHNGYLSPDQQDALNAINSIKVRELEKQQEEILERQKQIQEEKALQRYNQSQQQNNQGALEDGVGNGLGAKDYGRGIVYVGEMKNGEPDGQGTLYIEGEIRYVGGWKEGLKEGKGIWYEDGKEEKIIYKKSDVIGSW